MVGKRARSVVAGNGRARAQTAAAAAILPPSHRGGHSLSSASCDGRGRWGRGPGSCHRRRHGRPRPPTRSRLSQSHDKARKQQTEERPFRVEFFTIYHSYLQRNIILHSQGFEKPKFFCTTKLSASKEDLRNTQTAEGTAISPQDN